MPARRGTGLPAAKAGPGGPNGVKAGKSKPCLVDGRATKITLQKSELEKTSRPFPMNLQHFVYCTHRCFHIPKVNRGPASNLTYAANTGPDHTVFVPLVCGRPFMSRSAHHKECIVPTCCTWEHNENAQQQNREPLQMWLAGDDLEVSDTVLGTPPVQTPWLLESGGMTLGSPKPFPDHLHTSSVHVCLAHHTQAAPPQRQ